MEAIKKQNIASALRAYCGRYESQARAAHSLKGVSASTVSQMLNGNWELIGGYVSYAYGEPLQIPENDICVIYRRLSNAAWDYFMGINRTAPLADRRNYEGMVETFSALRFILRHRSRTMLYNFITDQFPYSASSCVPVGNFLGQETLSMDGAVTLAHRLSLPLLYMGMRVKEDGNYLIRYSIIAEDASQHAPGEMLRKYYDLLEADIRGCFRQEVL